MDYPVKVLILDTVMDRGGAEVMTMNYMRNMDRIKVQLEFLYYIIAKLYIKVCSI